MISALTQQLSAPVCLGRDDPAYANQISFALLKEHVSISQSLYTACQQDRNPDLFFDSLGNLPEISRLCMTGPYKAA